MNNQLAFTEQILGNHHITPERNGSVGIAVMKKKLRCHIPVMSEALQTRVEEVVALEMKCPKLSRNDMEPQWKRIRLGTTLLRLFTRVNLLVLLGDELGMLKQWCTPWFDG
ncbi:hypothetical protein Q9189_006681 [Teloschistes chrysophthalmus]